MCISRYQIEKMRREEIKRREASGEATDEPIDDVVLVEKRQRLTNIQSSDLLLELLNKHHKRSET